MPCPKSCHAGRPDLNTYNYNRPRREEAYTANRSRGNEAFTSHRPRADQYMREFEDLSSLGILQTSQLEKNIGHVDEDADARLDLSHSDVLDVVGADELLDTMNQAHMDSGMFQESYIANTSGYSEDAGINECLCQEPLSMLDQGQMGSGMFDPSYGQFGGSSVGASSAEPKFHSLHNSSLGMIPEESRNTIPNVEQPSEYDAGDVVRALKTESQMTVYDPEDYNTTMAPRTNNLATRREVLMNVLTREIIDHEEEESAEIDELLNSFQETRRHELMKLLQESG